MSKISLELRWAVIFAISILVWMLIERLTGLHGERIDQHYIYTNLFAIVAIVIYVLALQSKRAQLGGIMSWKQGFIAGVIISLVIAILSPLVSYLGHTFVSPDYFPNIIAHSVAIEAMTQAEAEAFFNLQSYMVQSAVFAFVVGVVTSAIVAVFVKRTA